MITTGFALGQSGVWTAGQFSEIMRLAAGDGVCLWGGAFAPELSGMTVTLATGFALVGGRWLKSDSPVSLSFPPPSIHADRVDAVAVCVEEGSKRVVLRVLAGVDLSGLHEGVMDTADGPACLPLRPWAQTGWSACVGGRGGRFSRGQHPAYDGGGSVCRCGEY